MKCPMCGGKDIASIMYGLPAFDEELEQKLKSKEIVLGGCCITEADSQYHCNTCNKNFARPPVLLSKHGIEDYRDIVTSIRFCDGGYFGGYLGVLISKRKGFITVDVNTSSLHIENPFHRKMEEDEWQKLLDKLYCRLYIHEWKKRFDNPDILDGEQWGLEIHLTGGRKRTYSGSNDYPPLWKELKSIFRPFFKEAGIKF